jgi:hypothetical protein
MKQCSKCKEYKEPTSNNFAKLSRSKDGLNSWCRICKNKNTNERTHRHKDFINSLRKPCFNCGEDDIACIDFHHVDESTKSFSIGSNGGSYSIEKILEEIAKCICLCSNCHRKHHAGRAIKIS